MGIAARFVETNLTKFAHTHYHEVDIAINLLLVLSAVLIEFIGWHCTVGEMNVCRVNVNELEKILIHSVVTALRRIGSHRIELIEAVDNHISEAYLARIVALHQFIVETKRCAAGGETEHEWFVAFMLFYSIDNDVGSPEHAITLLRTDSCRYFLELTYTLY